MVGIVLPHAFSDCRKMKGFLYEIGLYEVCFLYEIDLSEAGFPYENQLENKKALSPSAGTKRNSTGNNN